VDGECVNRVAIEIRMDDHGRMRTSLTRTGNAVSGQLGSRVRIPLAPPKTLVR
jgi:hypothetical protein